MDNKIVLEVLIVIFGTLAVSIRAVNYARLDSADRAVLAALIAPAFRIPAPVPAVTRRHGPSLPILPGW